MPIATIYMFFILTGSTFKADNTGMQNRTEPRIASVAFWLIQPGATLPIHFTFVLVASMRPTSILMELGRKLLTSWKGLQVSYYGGKYSIERVLALETFTSTASAPTTLVSAILPFLFTLTFVLAQELVPLQDPNDGWRSNYGFWIRVMIMVFVGTYSVVVHVSFFISGVSVSMWRKVVMSTYASICYTLCAMAISACLIFPVPFFILIMSPVFTIVLLLSFKVVLGSRTASHILAQHNQLMRYMCFVSVQILMTYVYPSYEALFRLAQGSRYQILVILLLPVIKQFMKTIVLRCTAHVEDLTPESVIFTVDFFNAVYISTCMQTASSAIAIAAMIIMDLSQTVAMLYGLHRRTVTLSSRLRAVITCVEGRKDLLGLVRTMCQAPDKFKNQTRAGIKILSCLLHDLPTKDRILLARLMLVAPSNSSIHISAFFKKPVPKGHISHQSRSKARVSLSLCKSSVYPYSQEAVQRNSQDESRPAESLASSPSSSMLLCETLETLFTIECLVGTAFLEALIPFLYCVYIMIMLHLPSAKYHSEMTGITRANVVATVVPVFVFGLLQVLSFIVLVTMIKRKCEVQAMYQLAFVLKTQMPLIQGKILFWAMITMCFRVAHFGKFGRAA